MDKMKQRSVKTRSIMRKITIPMVLVLLLQILIFWGTMISDGIFRELKNNAFAILNERVINRKNYLQNDMIQRWSNFGESIHQINRTISQTLVEYNSMESDLTIESPVTSTALDRISTNLIYLLRKQGVTGSFIIFNGPDSPSQTSDVSKSGIYIRDLDSSTNLENNSDLLFERAPSAITKKLKIPMDTNWSPEFEFTDDNSNSGDFYFKPFQAALEHPEMKYIDLGYWSSPFQLSKNDIEIITYSLPLINEKGVPYGIIGVEISTDYLKKLMPYSEICSNKEGSYLLAKIEDDTNKFEKLILNGPVFKQMLCNRKSIEFIPQEYGSNSYKVITDMQTNRSMYGCIQYFDLYNSNTPFENQRWALIGLLESNNLFGFSNTVGTEILLSTFVSLIIGLIVILIVSRVVTNPIAALVQKVKTSNPSLPVQFDKLHITEIDELSFAIEQLNLNVIETASKLSRILDMASFSIAAFEYTKESSDVFYTLNYFYLLGLEDDYVNSGYMDYDTFQSKMSKLDQLIDPEYSREFAPTYMIISTDAETSWVRLKIVEDAKNTFGVIEDITSEVLEKKKIEHERDYDLLTNLLNRRAFYSKLNDLFDHPELLETAVMIMFDLDNLKYINDTYGHDYGDKYIYSTAHILETSSPSHSIVSRMSGDEFYLFLYGYESKESALSDIHKIWTAIQTSLFPLPDNVNFRIRASMGYTWYPEDATSYEQLLHYADFAMYTVKNTTKGEMSPFSMEEYEKKSYLLQNREEFNQLVEHQLIDYHFQPIVDAKTGEIFAYEALMRSKLPTFKSPYEILSMARSQSKLYQIERLTSFLSLKSFVSKTTKESDCRIFINSIANQILSKEDIMDLEQLYKPYLHRIVIELTESEQQDETYLEIKKHYANRWNASIALDDFGSGYNGDMMLLLLNPHFVKADISIINGISMDKNRRTILRNLISYAAEQNIKVIAEGVETIEDMKTVVEMGVDYLQGYYLAMPAPNLQEIPASIKKELLDISK